MTEASREYSLRTFKEGDETRLTRLFNEVYSNYAGFTPRTVEYWRWCCLNRPTVEPNGICIAEKADNIVGYAVVAIDTAAARTQATVLEFCSTAEAASRQLVQWILEYAGEKKADSVSIDAPIDDETLRKTVNEFQFSQVSHPQPLMKVISFSQLIQEIAVSINSKMKLEDDVFHVHVSGVPAFFDSSFTVHVQDGKVTVEPEEVGTATVNVEADATTFTACIFGNTSVLEAVFKGKLKVQPFRKFLRVIRLFSAFQLRSRWFTPAGDFG